MTTDLMATIIDDLYMSDDFEFTYVGIRTQNIPFQMGAVDHTSQQSYDGDYAYDLDGLCVTYAPHGVSTSYKEQYADYISQHIDGQYARAGKYTALIGYDQYDGEGYDDAEHIAMDAHVVQILSA